MRQIPQILHAKLHLSKIDAYVKQQPEQEKTALTGCLVRMEGKESVNFNRPNKMGLHKKAQRF